MIWHCHGNGTSPVLVGTRNREQAVQGRSLPADKDWQVRTEVQDS